EGLGLAQIDQDTPMVTTRRHGRRAQVEPEIDGLLARATRLRQMLKDTERLLEIPHGLTAGPPPGHGLLPRLSAVGHRPFPTPPLAGPGGPGARPVRPPGPPPAPPAPPQCEHAAPAAAPTGGCRRPLRGSGHA